MAQDNTFTGGRCNTSHLNNRFPAAALLHTRAQDFGQARASKTMDKPCGKDRPAIPLPSTHFQARPSTATANQKPKTMVASLRTDEVAKIKIVHPININIYINININIKIKLEIKIVK